MRHLSAALAALVLCTTSTAFADASAVRVERARTGEPLPGVAMMAGYLTLTNAGTATIELRGASSDAFDRIEIHRTIVEDGQARMEPVDAIAIDPGERLRLEPGGLHLMMFRPQRVPQVGDTMSIVLHTDSGPIHVRMDVVDRATLLEQAQ